MVGFVRIADVPHFVISIIIALPLLIGLGYLGDFFHLHGDVGATLFLGGGIVIMVFSYWAGRCVWNRIGDRS